MEENNMVIDFSKLRQPSLDFIMKDEQHTLIRVLAPSLGLIKEVGDNLATICEALEGKEDESRTTSYELAAKCFSCNREGLEVSADDLQNKYKLEDDDLVVFYSSYVEFLDGLKKAKN
jgi:hypothetical protein